MDEDPETYGDEEPGTYEVGLNDEESESDDSEAYLLTEDVEIQIQETLRALKTNDPSIYDSSATFAPEIDHEKASDERKANKAERRQRDAQQLVEAEQFRIQEFLKEQVDKGGDSDEDDSDSEPFQLSKEDKSKLVSGFHEVEAGCEAAEEDDFFALDADSKLDKDLDEENDETITEKAPRRDPQRLDEKWVPLSENKQKDDFLHKYFANEWWRGENLSEIPVHRGLYGYQELMFEDKVSRNKFHHESENAFQLASSPRVIEGSLRKKKGKRKRQRENRKIREEKKKEEDLLKVKQKKKEFSKKIKALANSVKKETGVQLPRDYYDLEKEWDPTNWDNITGMLQDAELSDQQEAKLFDSLDQIHGLLAQYHGLDYEDSIGEGEDEIKFRYPYIEVPAIDDGLSYEEIFTLSPEELEKRAPMKIYASYKHEWDELEGKKRRKKFKKAKRKRDVYDNRFSKEEIKRGKHKKVKRELQKKGLIGKKKLKKKKKKNKKQKPADPQKSTE